MNEPLYSPEWYRVAQIKPRLRSHVSIARHAYRGAIWYIYRDETSGRTHRFSRLTHNVINLMNGKSSTTKIWQRLNEHLGDNAPSQDNLTQLLSYLHTSGLLATDVAGDASELASRSREQIKNDFKKRFSNPLALRIKLLNPDAFLERTLGYVQWAFNPWCGFAFFAIIAIALLFACLNWHALAADASRVGFTKDNLILLAFVYPIVKLFHELGHAYAVKKWHGEVNEIGVLFMVLMPIPYVDASASATFPQKSRRIVVSAAGIIVEMLLASLALFLWLASEDGIVKQLALNVILIGGLSTLLFNGNPLLRYDGYYVLADTLGIPNLAARSNKYIGYLIHRFAFGMETAVSPAHDGFEKYWLFTYSITSFLYRMFILVYIVIFLADSFFILGAALACWAVISQLVIPMARTIARTAQSPSVKTHRRRAMLATSCIGTLIYGLVFTLPLPHATVVEGVIVPSDDAQLRISSDGEIDQLFVQSNDNVNVGDPILTLSNLQTIAQVDSLKAELAGRIIEYAAQWATDPSIAEQTHERVIALEAKLSHATEKVERLTIRSATTGRLVLPEENDLKGRYVTQGTTVGYITNGNGNTVKALVSLERVPFLRQVDDVAVRVPGSAQPVFAAKMLRIAPSATDQLPSPVLGTKGGGKIATQVDKSDTAVSIGKYVLVDVAFVEKDSPSFIGQRVHVRFSHGSETLSDRIARSVRQLFLREFNV